MITIHIPEHPNELRYGNDRILDDVVLRNARSGNTRYYNSDSDDYNPADSDEGARG